MFPVTIIILHGPLSLSLSLFRFEKPPAPSRLDNVTTRDTCSSALFLLILDCYVFCLVRSPADLFLRDFVPHRQTSSSASNIPFWIKLQSRQSHHHSLSPGRRERLNSCQRINNYCHRTSADSPHGFPPSSHRPPQLATASGLGRVGVSPLPGTFRALHGSCGPLCPGVL